MKLSDFVLIREHFEKEWDELTPYELRVLLLKLQQAEGCINSFRIQKGAQ